MLGLHQHERNGLEDVKRLVDHLRKAGAVDHLHNKALKELSRNEVFRSQLRQWMQDKGSITSGSQADMEALQDIALSALVGLLAGDPKLQPSTADAAAGGQPAAVLPQQLTGQPQQQQQQQPLLLQQQQLGQTLPGQQQQQQRLLSANKLPAPLHRQQQSGTGRLPQRQQQQDELSAADDVELRLKVALLNMLEQEELLLQERFKQCYSEMLHSLQFGRPLTPPDFTQQAPKNVSQSPGSPSKALQAASEAEREHSGHQQGVQAGSTSQRAQQQESAGSSRQSQSMLH